MSSKNPQLPPMIQKKMTTYPAFYQKVWKACSQIPKGEVRTYQQLARSVGVPGGARAVGNALKMNPFAPTVPCHRVVRSDGKMGGYSAPGGIKTKRRLLVKEGALQN